MMTKTIEATAGGEGTATFTELYAALAGLGYEVTHYAGEGKALIYNTKTNYARFLTTDDLYRLLERWDGNVATLPELLHF